MNSNCMTKLAALLVAMSSWTVIAAQETPTSSEAKPPTMTKEERDAKRAEAMKRLETKKEELAKLRGEALEVTRAMGKLAAETNQPTQEDTLAMMKQMLQQLVELNERLLKLEGEIKDIMGWMEGQNESQAVIAGEVAEARRFRPAMYTQFQYRNSDRQTASASSRASFFGTPFSGGRESAFAFRRVRFGATYNIDPKTLIRFSMDGATGTTTDAFQLRDAALVYTIQPSDSFVPTELTAGQFALPLGYELERSSGDREFPERAQYNRVMFNGERTRGAMMRHAVSDKLVATLGVGASLSNQDSEQTTRGSMPNGRAAMFGALRYETTTISAGISHFQGERPSFRTAGSTGTTTVGTTTVVTAASPLTAPRVDRRFTYLDATFVGLIDPKLTLRFEGMVGSDRIPIANTQNAGGASDAARVDADDMNGFQVQALYNLSPRFQLYGRYESFDPDVDQDNDAITGWGGGFRYFINPNASISFTAERFRVPQLTVRSVHSVYTLRYQFRF